MKNSSKLMIALAVTLILSLVSLTVWAAPGRMGTVPTPPMEVDLTPGDYFTLGTFEVSSSVAGTATRIEDPEKDLGPAPDGFYFLSDAVTFKLEEKGDLTVCYPYPQWVEDQKGDIYKWDEVTEEWVVVESTVSGDPPMICFTDKVVTGGSYSLLGG
jgi:hypothetical protein